MAYPNYQDLKVIQTAVNIFLSTRNGATRDAMAGAARAILDRYNIPRISFLDYIIERGEDGGIWVVPRRFTDGTVCPVCGASLYGYKVTIISIHKDRGKDMVTYGCSCGTITGKWETK